MHILFVDDEPRILDALKRMLWQHRNAWTMQFAVGPRLALAALGDQRFDMVITDMKMPEMDGAALLEIVMQKWPGTARLVLSGQTDDQAAERVARVAHQFVSKPCEPKDLVETITRISRCRALVPSEHARAALGRIEIAPSRLSAYEETTVALSDPSPFSRVATLIRRDPGLMATVLRLVNTSFFGLTRELTRLEDALGAVGLEPLRSFMARSRRANETALAMIGASRSMDDDTKHARLVSAIAASIAPPDVVGQEAAMAALMHDIGASVQATWAPPGGTLPPSVGPALDGDSQPSDPNVGAYLLGLWGFHPRIVMAVAHHRRPADADESHAAVAATVHVAKALAKDVTEPGSDAVLALDGSAVGRVGGVSSLSDWRALAAAIAGQQAAA